MNALNTLDDLTRQLDACAQGELTVAQLSQHWRTGAASLPLFDNFIINRNVLFKEKS